MRMYTIGFTKSDARHFFERLRAADVRRIVDVRLNNVSQLAGFAKRDDLAYFSRELCGADYVHVQSLAPTSELLDAYKKKKMPWLAYEAGFLSLMESRQIASTAADLLRDGDCLLCSEATPARCHRRLVVEYLQAHGVELDVINL